jgi:hypothetical protein
MDPGIILAPALRWTEQKKGCKPEHHHWKKTVNKEERLLLNSC